MSKQMISRGGSTASGMKYHRGRALRGGRMTKRAGQVVSCASAMGAVALAGKTSATAIFASAFMLIGVNEPAFAGACTRPSVFSGNWTGSGAAAPGVDVTQNLLPGVGGSVAATTDADFAITTINGNAINIANLLGPGSISFFDDNGASIIGRNNGIFARNRGLGSLSITSNGFVRGVGRDAIDAQNLPVGLNLTVSTADVTGFRNGIRARNQGSGRIFVESTGTVTGQNRDGIIANNSASGTDVVISVVDVTAGRDGIRALNNGSGTVDVDARNVSGARNGIVAQNSGTGSVTVEVTESASGGSQRGIDARNSASGTDLTILAGQVTGQTDGIRARNFGSGEQSITVSGPVSGRTGYAIRTITNGGSLTRITLEDGASVTGDSGLSIFNNNGDSITTVNAGAGIDGAVNLNGGDDEIVMNGGVIAGGSALDGGDGFDAIRVLAANTQLTGADLSNWELLDVDGGSLRFSDGSVTIGSADPATGVLLQNFGTLDAGDAFEIIGNLTTRTGGELNATGGGAGTYRISRNVTNDGVLTTQDGVAGDVITINGDYTGSGLIRIDTVLEGDASPTDRVIIEGDSSGTGTVNVQNPFGTGDVTTTGIEVITVEGASNADFSLVGGNFVTPGGDQAILAGAYIYTLQQNAGGNWALLSRAGGSPDFQPGAPVYESYPRTLLALTSFDTLKQRVGERHSEALEASSRRFRFVEPQSRSPLWVRLDGSDLRIDPDSSSTGTESEIDTWVLQGGADFQLYSGSTGYVVGGPTFHYGTADGDASSSFGDGNIDTTAYGLGIASTWYSYDGLYVDGQLQYSRFDSDLSSATLGELTNGNKGDGYGASIEVGRSFATGEQWVVIPQAQLSYTSVDFDDFTGPNGERVSLDDAESLLARVGVAVEYLQPTDRGENSLYGIFNVYREFKGDAGVLVSGVDLTSTIDDWSAEIGVGSSFAWSETVNAYSELSYATGLENVGDSRRIKASLGLRVAF